MPDSVVLTLVEVSPSTVQRGDLIEIGQRQFEVSDFHDEPDGGKRLRFTSGEDLLIRTGTRLFAMREIRVRTRRAMLRARGTR
ncbi:hypothetical protein I5Q34_13745 [Streptomyces sp. AV19]|uniref:hypothetical protein n=1 Tax=Streptomyces sp. AV19 TaxID=2793068 RepID=UPI0018FF0C3D|nr:hypothetical protein [Streptomyces sp. AV19]MBH1935323.1 hypothetical protein [Streptomyces sp. AV19]MDG4531208.1 hypothetical protein [Streptomyces sp. AV19]